MGCGGLDLVVVHLKSGYDASTTAMGGAFLRYPYDGTAVPYDPLTMAGTPTCWA